MRTYDFQRQETIERGHLRRLEPVLEVLAHRISGSLTSRMRTPVHVDAGAVEQIRWEEYAERLPEPTFLSSTTVTPMGGRIVLHVPLPLCMAIVEVRLGGDGTTEIPLRPLTEIEQVLVRDIADAVLAEVPSAFTPIIPLTIGPTTSVSNSVFLQVAKPTEYCGVVNLEVGIGDLEPFTASLCIPFTVLLPIVDALERLDVAETPTTNSEVVDKVRGRLAETAVDVAVCYPPVTLSSDDLLTLAPGDVIPLHREPIWPLLLTAAGSPLCQVVPVVRDRRLSCVVVAADPNAAPAELPAVGAARTDEEK